jgi:hypothetical protein
MCQIHWDDNISIGDSDKNIVISHMELEQFQKVGNCAIKPDTKIIQQEIPLPPVTEMKKILDAEFTMMCYFFLITIANMSTIVFPQIWQQEYMNLETLNERVQAQLGVPKSTLTFSQSSSVNTSEFSIVLHSKRWKIMESGCDVSLVNNASYDQLINEMIPSKGLQAGQKSVGINSMLTLEEDVIIIGDDDEEEKDLERHGITDNKNSMEMDIRANSNMHVPIPIEVAHIVSVLKYDREAPKIL